MLASHWSNVGDMARGGKGRQQRLGRSASAGPGQQTDGMHRYGPRVPTVVIRTRLHGKSLSTTGLMTWAESWDSLEPRKPVSGGPCKPANLPESSRVALKPRRGQHPLEPRARRARTDLGRLRREETRWMGGGFFHYYFGTIYNVFIL